MIVCPECEQKLKREDASVACCNCGWTREEVGPVAVYLSARDRNSHTFAQYLKNYDAISDDDLSQDVLDKRYVNYQAENLFESIAGIHGADVCDLGCGQGVLSRKLAKSGANSVTAVDISLSYLSRLGMEEGVTPILANAENLPFKDEFDIVVSTDVMEHVLNLGSFLYSLNRSLKKGGMAYIRVPYNENLLQYSPHFGCSYEFVHLRSFNRDLMKKTMEDGGFDVLAISLDGFVLGTPQEYWMRTQTRMHWYEKFKRFVEKRFVDLHVVTKWSPWIARLFMRPLEMVVIAKKVKQLEKVPNGGFVLT